MTKPVVSDEMLIALADGELAAAEADRLHAQIMDDPELAERFAILAETRFLLEAEGEAKQEAVPERFLSAIAAAEARPAAVQPKLTVIAGGAEAKPAGNLPPRAPRAPWRLPLAASFLLVAGGVAGYLVAGRGGPDAGRGIAVAGLDRAALSAALDTVASGGAVALPGGALRIIASHKLADGRLCREYAVSGAGQGTSGWNGVDCRDGQGWRTEFVAATQPEAPGYKPASGGALAEAFLLERGAEGPLDPAAEQGLLKGAR
ncbi:anti-sigma factor family protein [Bosea sp. (in: a-proteobacteria)]|uniref:anti-sigma factor family protein n=1 Tax=Bosea sp. (in: a-proteobacteria) TaxID=1871050 RepID=UPI002FC91987